MNDSTNNYRTVDISTDIQIETENSETMPETVSGNEVPEDSVSGNNITDDNVTVSGNDINVNFDNTDMLSSLESINMQLTELNAYTLEMHFAILGISGVCTTILFFTIFKWCEQKIKRFAKGVFNKHE